MIKTPFSTYVLINGFFSERIHHKFIAPTPIGTMANHPIESMIQFVLLPLMYLTPKLSPFFQCVDVLLVVLGWWCHYTYQRWLRFRQCFS